MSELWGGDVPILESDPSELRLCRYRYHFKPIPPAPPVSIVFLDLYFPSSILLLPLHHRPFIFVYLSLFCTCSPPPLPARSAAQLDFAQSRQPPLIVSASWATCLCMNPFVVTVQPALCHPWPAPRSLSDPGVFAHHGSLHIPCAFTSP